MTELAAEAALVAEALGGEVRGVDGQRIVIVVKEWQETFWSHSSLWGGIVGLARDVRRLRETEQERDELRDVVRGLEQTLRLATSAREVGLSHCIVSIPAQGPDATAGHVRPPGEPPVPEPAYEPPERCCDEAGWADDGLRRAERSFG